MDMQSSPKVRHIKKQKEERKMSTATSKMKFIKATPSVSGRFAKEVVYEALRKPSETSVKRNKDASMLLKKLRG